MKTKIMKKAFFLALIACSGIAFSQSYQDSIILLNGNVFRGKILKLSDDFLSFESMSKKGPEELRIELYRIFSYTQNSQESILYKHDTITGNFLKVDESRKYALGGYDARQTFTSKPVFYSSIAASFAFSLFDSYLTQKGADELNLNPAFTSEFKPGFFGNRPTILPLAMPLTLGISFGLTNVRVKEQYILQKQLKNDLFYYEGFNKVAKQKRTFAALKGSLIGIGLGYISYSLFRINSFE